MTMLSIANPNRETRSVHACSYSSYVGYARVSGNGSKLNKSRCPEPGMICSVLCTDMVVRGLVIRCLISNVMIYRTYGGKIVQAEMAFTRPSTPENSGTDNSVCPGAPRADRRSSRTDDDEAPETTSNGSSGSSAQQSLIPTMASRATTPERPHPLNNGN